MEVYSFRRRTRWMVVVDDRESDTERIVLTARMETVTMDSLRTMMG
jgi:hypothetical protein